MDTDEERDPAKETPVKPDISHRNSSRPNLTRIETKNAITDKTAKAILETERLAVEAKTERLRAARLKHEKNELAAAAKKK